MALIEINIISDIICPWCYIGYRSLQKSIALYQKTYPGGSSDEFKISWKPYFIDQEAPSESILIQDRMLRRMDPKQVQAAQTRLKRAGADMGLNVKLGGYIGSSRLAHRLLFMAEKEKGPGKQCEVAELLFHHQFEREADTSKLDVVIAAGVQAGFHEDEVRDWLEESNAGRLETEKEAKEVRAAGVTGVPHFVIGETRHLDGVVDLSEFFQAFIEARQRQEDGLRLDALS